MSAHLGHRITNIQSRLFLVLGVSIGLGIFGALYFNQLAFLGFPLLPIMVFIAIVDFRLLYYLLFAAVPLSIAVEIGLGFSTDIPSEPLMIGLSVITILHVIINKPAHASAFFKHPISLFLILQIGWTLISVINSEHQVIGIKFLLAKIWYVVPFYVLSGMLLTDNRKIIKTFKMSIVPMVILILIILVRHSLEGFAFKQVNFVMGPFFINHVVYGALAAILLPFVVLLINKQAKGFSGFSSGRIMKGLLLILFITALFQSFCRAAIIAVFISIGSILLFRAKFIKPAIVTALLALSGLIIFLEHNNKYLDYAPEYTQAVSHERFDQLISATSQGKDVSTMERVYRWVAGSRMLTERPIVGFGPGSFPVAYKPYTVNNFKTYVSQNEDGSSIHSAFLMHFVDQGIVGGVIFLLLTIVSLIYGQRVYHFTKDELSKQILLATLFCLVTINAMNLINDLLELDKIGAYYFTCLAIIVVMDLRIRGNAAGTIQHNQQI